MKKNKAHVIYDDYDVSMEDWNDLYEEIEEDQGEALTEDEKYRIFYNELGNWIDAERCNLDIRLSEDIIAIASLGLWDGRRTGYKIIGNNISDILYSECDYNTWTCDRYNVRGRGIHHDGVNYILYRVFREGITDEQKDRFLDALYNGEANDRMVRRYTRSLAPEVKAVYGWK